MTREQDRPLTDGQEEYRSWTREEYLQKQRELLERHVTEHNATIIPDTPGHVRTEGPRRQYREEIIGGVLHVIEI